MLTLFILNVQWNSYLLPTSLLNKVNFYYPKQNFVLLKIYLSVYNNLVFALNVISWFHFIKQPSLFSSRSKPIFYVDVPASLFRRHYFAIFIFEQTETIMKYQFEKGFWEFRKNQLVIELKLLHRTGSLSIWSVYEVLSVCRVHSPINALLLI